MARIFVRDLLKQYGLRPRKGMGQHFLVNEEALSWIAQAARLTPDDVVVEVGPGLGSLTALLAEQAHEVVAVELDRDIAAVLPRILGAYSNVRVVQGNILRNLLPKRPAGTTPGDPAGIGIYVEADTSVTGNVVENAAGAGLVLGWGPYLRDVAATGNVVRRSGIGVAVSVVPGARAALIANNVISGSRRGAIVGMDHARPVTGDLTPEGAGRFPHLTLQGNRTG